MGEPRDPVARCRSTGASSLSLFRPTTARTRPTRDRRSSITLKMETGCCDRLVSEARQNARCLDGVGVCSRACVRACLLESCPLLSLSLQQKGMNESRMQGSSGEKQQGDEQTRSQAGKASKAPSTHSFKLTISPTRTYSLSSRQPDYEDHTATARCTCVCVCAHVSSVGCRVCARPRTPRPAMPR